MDPKKSAPGVVVAATLVASLGVGGACYAAAADYTPTLLGNDYDNRVDERNAYTVEGMNYTAPIASQNGDAVAAAQGASVTVGQQGEGATPILLTNSLGKTVKEFTFRLSDEAAYPGNQMSGTLADGESAGWFYTYDYGTHDYTDSQGRVIAVPNNCLMQVTFDDGTTAEFHNVNTNGVRTIDLRHSDEYGVYYVARTTITNHTPDPNLYYEANLAGYEGPAEEFDYHVNSAGAMGARQITESRGGAWETGKHSPTQDIADYGADIPMLGESSGDYTDGVYDDLYWNEEGLAWR